MRRRTWEVIVGMTFAAAVFAAGATHPALAARDPSLDPTCWLKDQCEKAPIKGTHETDAACGGAWGRCYVKQEGIPLQVKLPGLEKQEVRDLGEYLRVGYVWAVRVAAVLAVVVIMVGGLLWLTSGGADRIATAKSLIGNAVIGLLLTVGSYLILQTVNPDLVALRLPRTFIIRPLALGTKFCAQLDENVEIRNSSATGEVLSTDRRKLRCNNIYYTPSALTKTCLGDSCAERGRDHLCVPVSATTYECVKGTVGGEVVGDGVAYLEDTIALYVMCAGTSFPTLIQGALVQERNPKRLHAFTLPVGPDYFRLIREACGATITEAVLGRDQKVRGFVLRMSVAAAGLNDAYDVGAGSCGGSSIPITVTPEDKGDPNKIEWSRVLDDKLFDPVMMYQALRRQNPQPFRCQITLTRSNFPDR